MMHAQASLEHLLEPEVLRLGPRPPLTPPPFLSG